MNHFTKRLEEVRRHAKMKYVGDDVPFLLESIDILTAGLKGMKVSSQEAGQSLLKLSDKLNERAKQR
jgi:hypothetical protein